MKQFAIKLLATSAFALAISTTIAAKATETDKPEEKIVESNFDFTFSPDGQDMIYYAYKGKALPDIFKKPHHGEEINLTHSSETWDIEPDYSPDGSKIVYSSGDSMAVMTLRIMNADGSDNQLLLDLEDSIVGASWSPNGKKIAFSTFKMGSENPEGDIFLINEDGSGLTNLTQTLNRGALKPNWSLDGKHIYFVASEQKEGPTEIYRMNVNGTGHARLTDLSLSSIKAFDAKPTPDGNTLVFTAEDKEGWTDIYSMPANASHLVTKIRKITDTKDASEYFLSFTPNGHHLTFSRGDWENGFSFAHLPVPGSHN